MNAADNNLVQLVTGKQMLQEVTVDELQKLTQQYPYFSLAHLLLLQKLKEDTTADFEAQSQHSTVYFQDTAWLQGYLYNKRQEKNESAARTTEQPEILPEETAVNTEESEKEKLRTPASLSDTTDEPIENSNLITLPAEDVLDDFTLQMEDVKAEPELPPLDEEEIEHSEEAAVEASAKIADVLQHQVADFKAPMEKETELPPPTEPYHTIDYFASQGIKVDAQQQDAFSKKVHTFTDWLRQMKRISNYPNDLGSDPEMESFVQTIADTSNQPKAVDTEAMAAVLVKQGKFDKAIEVYEKLSLQNPGKTAYFAAKINQLKA